MDGVPPTPSTSVSVFVGVLMLLTGIVVTVALIAVRRRHRTPVTLGVVVVTLLVLAAGGIFLIIPPQVPSTSGAQAPASCPYDRLVWSNMSADVDDSWLPCRRVARVQLTLTLLGASLVTVMAAVIAVRKPHSADVSTEVAPGGHARVDALGR